MIQIVVDIEERVLAQCCKISFILFLEQIVMSCHVMSRHVRSGQVMSGQVRSCHVRSGQVMSCHVMSCHTFLVDNFSMLLVSLVHETEESKL